MRFFVLVSIITTAFGLAAAQASEAARGCCSGAAVIHEMNLARQHPDLYAGYISQLRARFRGRFLVLSGRTLLRTQEGVGAIDEAVRFLQDSRPLAPLILSRGMSEAAAEHVAEQAAGGFGHGGAGFSNPASRLNHYGIWSGGWGENLSYGRNSARDIVVALIIDDGQRGRKHRRNIFNPAFHFAGAALGPHARYRTVCSMEFAADYAEQPEATKFLARN